MKPKLTPELAEFIGIMLGDGYLCYPRTPRIKIAFNSVDDKKYFVFVKKLLGRLFKVNIIEEHRKNERTSNLFIFNREVIRFLIDELNLVPAPKWNRALIPQWIFKHHLEKYIIRGYFDTDGSLVVANNNGIKYPRLEMKISPSPMQEQFVEILSKFGFHFGVYNIGKGKVRIQMNGIPQLIKWKENIDFSNPKHARKCDLFLK